MAIKTYYDTANSTTTVGTSDLIVVQQGATLASDPTQMKKTTIADLLKTNVVSSFQSTTDNTHVASEKLVKDNLDLKANLASPVLTGTPTAPTAENTTSNTQIATTAFVHNVINSEVASAISGEY